MSSVGRREHASPSTTDRARSEGKVVRVRPEAPGRARVRPRVRHHGAWSGSTIIVVLTVGLFVAGGLPLLRSASAAGPAGGGTGGGQRVPEGVGVNAPLPSAYPYLTPPAPGVTPSPEPDPGRYSPAGATLAAQSSSRALAVAVGKELVPGYRTVSVRLTLTLGSDFATRLDRSIRLYGPDNIRYLADEPALEPSLLGQPGPALDGWVTFLLPVSRRCTSRRARVASSRASTATTSATAS